MKNRLIPALVIVLIFLGLIFFVRNRNSQAPTLSDQIINPSPMNSPTPISEVRNELLAGGSSFLDPNGVYQFLYPNDYRIDSQGENITRISKTGGTQQGQTEMYDGVIVVFESINLQGKPLSEWVDTYLKTVTQDGTTQITKPKKSIVVNGYPGFTFTQRGLGETDYIVLQKDTNSDSAVSITNLVADPQKVGFQEEVDAIISTVKLIK